MKESEVSKVAEYIKRVVKDGEKPEKVKLEVVRFISDFQKVQRCFE